VIDLAQLTPFVDAHVSRVGTFVFDAELANSHNGAANGVRYTSLVLEDGGLELALEHGQR